MATQVDIYNRAWFEIGHTRKVNAITDGTPEANDCNTIYDGDREQLLSRGRWGFAKDVFTLALTLRTPKGWAFEYYYPLTCLTALEIARDNVRDKKIPFQVGSYYDAATNVEKKVIWTNHEFASLVGIRNIKNPLMFSPMFTAALVSTMAAKLSLTKAKDTKLSAQKMKEAMYYFSEAVRVGEVEAEDEETQDPNWITDR